MSIMTLLAFLLLGSSFVSLWVKRDPKIWGTLIGLSVLSGIVAGHVTWVGLVFIIGFALMWFFYDRKPSVLIFFMLVALGLSFKLRLLPGFVPYFITPKFAVGLQNPLVGFFPLALIVPLAKDFRDWKEAIKGVVIGCIGIAILGVIATLAQATRWDFNVPSHMGIRLLSNLVLTSIPEEGFYRGFIQRTLCDYFKNSRIGSILALILTSIVFGLSHIYWSPNPAILGFAFLAGLLYGGVYLYSRRIESAILCHFLFNLIHMTFFSYHAE